MNLFFRGLTLALCFLVSTAVLAESPEAIIKKALQHRIGDGAPIESITKTPYSGLYELKIGNEIVYSDAEGKYVFIGRVIDVETSKDITQARMDELNRIKFADLPLELAAKSVKGNGKRVIAVFEDPNCGYCKRFRKTLSEMKDVTVYTYMYPILGDDSKTKARNLWCASDKSKAWDDWMINGKAAAAAPEACKATEIDKVVDLGKKYRVTGTPTIFFSDGSRIPGAIDAKALEGKLASMK
jgi:thiol:disulfide interchange protein DsbC